MKKLAIIGASYLQVPLIQKAKSMGLETHVFAWACGDDGERLADVFYPISIVEKEAILRKCREIGIDGVCSIASDLAMLTVGYVAHAMGLTGNTPEAIARSTDKHLMRLAFEAGGDPSPKSLLVESTEDVSAAELHYPVIVKPLDRSGSRGITKLESAEGLPAAIEYAREQGFQKKALVEEFAEGKEYSVECISWQGQHHFLALTEKFTTGAPHFIETGHREPATVSDVLLEKIRRVTFHALNSLGIEYGASHTEIKIDANENIRLIEIGGRMGGDFIGSDLVYLSTGVDFVAAVIDVALGREPDLTAKREPMAAEIRFVFSPDDVCLLEQLRRESPQRILRWVCDGQAQKKVVTDSSNRHGYWIFTKDA